MNFLNSEPKVSSKIINPASSGDLEQVLQKLRSSNPMEITDALELIDNQHLTGAIDALEYLLNDPNFSVSERALDVIMKLKGLQLDS